jgi:hypothetical protein
VCACLAFGDDRGARIVDWISGESRWLAASIKPLIARLNRIAAEKSRKRCRIPTAAVPLAADRLAKTTVIDLGRSFYSQIPSKSLFET